MRGRLINISTAADIAILISVEDVEGTELRELLGNLDVIEHFYSCIEMNAGEMGKEENVTETNITFSN